MHRLGSPIATVALALLLLVSSFATTDQRAQACFWDNDTLAQERARFPDALELITGKFARHSDAFYRWRIADRQVRLAKGPDAAAFRLPLLDDIGVAHDKLGQHEKALAIGAQLLALAPQRYETHANLGTFMIHAGDYEGGLKHNRRAIEINPAAHFGREVYQQRLVEWMLAHGRKGGELVLPIEPGFNAFLDEHEPAWKKIGNDQNLPDGLHGLLGMMRFGSHTHPVLLQAVGDLLRDPEMPGGGDGKQLAARAYLRASYETKAPVADRYRARADEVRNRERSRTRKKIDEIEQEFRGELTEAAAWYALLVADEARWIAAGIDVEAEYIAAYLQSDNPIRVFSEEDTRYDTPPPPAYARVFVSAPSGDEDEDAGASEPGFFEQKLFGVPIMYLLIFNMLVICIILAVRSRSTPQLGTTP